MGVVIYNGQSSEDFGLHVTYRPDYDLPVRDVEEITLPGRDGTILYDNGRYDKTERKYAMTFGDEDVDFYDMAIKMSKWLNSSPSKYVRLSDSYEPDVYRLARFVPDGPILPVLENAGGLEVTFECLPQRFYKTGEDPILYKMKPIEDNLFSQSNKDDSKSSSETYVYRVDLNGSIPYVLYPYISYGGDTKASVVYYKNSVRTEISVESDGSFVTPAIQDDTGFNGTAFVELTLSSYSDYLDEDVVSVHKYHLNDFTINNYTNYSSKPVIKINPKVPDINIYMDGIYVFDIVETHLGLEGKSYEVKIDLSNSPGYKGSIIIDCEQMDCYGYNDNGSIVNLNPCVTFTKKDNPYAASQPSSFPVFVPNQNKFKFLSMTYEVDVEVTPNWWTI